MATIDQLYARIILDTNRDDLGSGGEFEQAKIDAVADAIEDYADEAFWFNRIAATITTVAGSSSSALPAGMRFAALVSYLGSSLPKVPIETIEDAYNASTQTIGVPAHWADSGSTIGWWPTPDANYLLSVYGTADLGVPVSGGSNVWTTSGYRLILAAAKKILYRGSLRDPDGMQLAAAEEAEALAKLRRETRRRGVAELRSDTPRNRRTFNITRGW
jgi:hypothetical protein